MALKLRLHELDKLAREAGYVDYVGLLHDLYETKGMGLVELAERCHIAIPRLKRHLARYKIPLHKRGGANNVKIVLTQALIDEATRDGVPAVAARLGVPASVLYQRLKRLSS